MNKENTICQCGKEKAWDENFCPECHSVANNKTHIVNPQQRQMTPSEMISQAVSKGADLSQLRELLEIQKDREANEAKKAYHVAMANFKKEPIRIDKDKHVDFATSKGRMKYDHASLANVLEKVTSKLSDHGLSVSWTTKQNGYIIVTCKITHSLGHSEETSLQAEADSSGSKNSIQAIGSTITYLQRYTLLSSLGLATADQDNDGSTATFSFISEKQLHNLRDLIISKNLKEEPLCKYLEIESLEELPESSYMKALQAIQAAKAREK